MAALPTIYCNGYYFTPQSPGSEEITYVFLHSSERIEIRQKDQSIRVDTPSTGRFPLDHDFQIMERTQMYTLLTLLVALVSGAVVVYFQCKENYNLGGVSAGVVSSISFITAFYLDRQCMRQTFDVANKVICTHRGKETLYDAGSYYADRVLQGHLHKRRS